MKAAEQSGEIDCISSDPPPTEGVTSEELVHEVLDAFSEGSARPVVHSEASSGRAYETVFQATLNARLPPEDASYFWKCLGRRQEALEAARNNQLDTASRKFALLRQEISAAALAEESRLFLQVFLEAAEAYLYYRSAQYERGRELLLHASALDHLLAERFGYHMMSAHRLQLAHNLLRLHNRRGESRQVVEIGAAFLDYLELRTDTVPAALGSPRALLDSVPVGIASYYFDKICSECALVLAGSNDDRVEKLFCLLAHHARPQHHPDEFGRMAHEWLRLKSLALSGDAITALTAGLETLRKGRRSEPLLWFATIIDVAALCRSFESDGNAVATEMIRMAAKLDDAPFALRQLA